MSVRPDFSILAAMNKLNFLWVLAVLNVVVGCAQGEPEGGRVRPESTSVPEEPQVLSVFTVNYPLQYFAERIGGDRVEVTFPAPAEVDPAYWAPGPEIVADYQQADLILLNGVGYAKWLERATLPAGKLVDTSVAFKDRWIPLEQGSVHSHGPEGEHSHKGYAFTTWLDPELAIEQAGAVAQALIEALPEHESSFQASLEALIADLRDLDKQQEAETTRIGDQPLLFSHPVYQYLEARYGLNAVAVHWEPGEDPGEEQWQELESILVGHPARWMIWEGEPSAATAQRLESLGVQSVVYAPCANTPSAGDLYSVLQGNVAALPAIGSRK